LALGAAGKASAQDNTADDLATSEEVVVTGEIRYRNRVDGAVPVLEYGLDYFQRFEPLTVGDMLKRTPSAAFVGSDVGEYDRLQLRGLGAGYTQVLINGESVPGSEDDRSFFVDRIPAELIERVEILRSASANRSGDAVAGALNIVTRDAYSFNGAFVRAGALQFTDDEIEPVFGAVASGQLGPGRIIAGLNIQGRHNPKTKVSQRFEEDGGVFEFDNREDQSDVRDGTDYSFNAAYLLPLGNGAELELSGFYVRTDRTEEELSRTYEDEASIADADLVELVPQLEDILQENYSLGAELTLPMFGGETQVELGFARFQDDIVGTEETTEYDPFPTVDAFEGTREIIDLVDEEASFELQHERDFGDFSVEFGVDYRRKERESLITEAEIGAPGDPYDTFELSSEFSLYEQRIDPYVMFSGQTNAFQWEAGLRYETTEVEIEGFADYDDDDIDDFGTAESDYAFLLPSAHLRFDLTDNDRINFSVARTVRRPNFDSLSPVAEDEAPTEDYSFIGNPELEPESAWGLDAGYERRLGQGGIAGINLFYRDIQDLIEIANTGLTYEGLPLLSPQNVGDGTVWGVEFDFSAPLTLFGLENTGVFVNYSWLDSEVTDPVTGGDRRFNDQAESVYNIGFIQDLPALNTSFGASYRQQGDAFVRIQGEEVTTTYSGDLEIFVEHRLGDNFTIRFTGSNLLDAEKEEVYNTYETLASQLNPAIESGEELEFEREESGPVFQLVGRYAF